MDIVEPLHIDERAAATSAISPVESLRIRALAERALTGAPALTSGEVRELAGAVTDHNDRPDGLWRAR